MTFYYAGDNLYPRLNIFKIMNSREEATLGLNCTVVVMVVWVLPWKYRESKELYKVKSYVSCPAECRCQYFQF